MNNQTKCSECGRVLTDSESQKRGTGPVCAAKLARGSEGNALMGLDL